MLGKRASGIDAEKKTVKLSEGGDVPYDRLLIATGSRPFIPHIEGYEAACGKTTFMSLDDAEKLERMIDKDSRVLIIGAGLIGLKCAEGLYGRVKSITVVDLADRVLPSILDSEGSRIVRERLESKGIKLLLGESADNVKDGVATLKSGVGLGFDVMVMAAGVRPNTEIFEGEKRKGIVTNNRCETSVPDVYAAGDCTESFDITTGGNRIMALLPNAYMQGECAA
jgi:NADPH-dependent 2,4-dienoyl-CoA reductase/sulfur reductase-like enzyme